MTCKFCGCGKNIIPVYYQNKKVNSLVHESQNFYVIVSIGAVVEGHLLIIPKSHYWSMGELPDELITELSEITFYIENMLKSEYKKNVICFEHGTGNKESVSAASVVHAHLHILPISESITDSVKHEGHRLIPINGFKDLSKYADAGESYLFFRDIDNKMYCVEGTGLPSQYFRRIVCETFNMENWDWHHSYNIDNVYHTVQRLNRSDWTQKK